MLLQIYWHQTLPRSFLACFAECEIRFVRVSVSGDLNERIGNAVKCSELIEKTNFTNLGSYARKRDVVRNGAAWLEKRMQLMLGEKLDKA
jgi:hypothetical protein